MTQKQLAYASMRIGAVVILLVLLNKFPGTWGFVLMELEQMGRVTSAASLIFLAASFLLAAAMWFFPVSMARGFGIWNLEAGGEGPSGHWLTEALLTVIGLYLAALALADLAYYAAYHLSIRDVLGAPGRLPPDTVAGYAASAVQLGLGLVLAVGARHIARLLGRLRPLDGGGGGQA